MNKRTAAVLSLLLCLGVGALRVADLLLWSDPATGFARLGQAWYRYGVAAAAAAARCWLTRAASPCPAYQAVLAKLTHPSKSQRASPAAQAMRSGLNFFMPRLLHVPSKYTTSFFSCQHLFKIK